MRFLALLAAIGIVACQAPRLVAPENASEISETTGSWIEPAGRYGIDFDRFGWVTRTSHRPASIVEMVPGQPWATEAYCAVWEAQRIPAPTPQAEVNAAMRRHTRDTAISANIQSDDLSFWHDEVDGISTVDLRFHDQSLYQRWRMFRLSTPTGVILINVVCGARLPTSTEQEGELDAIVETLRFIE